MFATMATFFGVGRLCVYVWVSFGLMQLCLMPSLHTLEQNTSTVIELASLGQ